MLFLSLVEDARKKFFWGSRTSKNSFFCPADDVALAHTKKGIFKLIKKIFGVELCEPHNVRCEMDFSAQSFTNLAYTNLFRLSPGGQTDWIVETDAWIIKATKLSISTLKHKRIKWKWRIYIWFEAGDEDKVNIERCLLMQDNGE